MLSSLLLLSLRSRSFLGVFFGKKIAAKGKKDLASE